MQPRLPPSLEWPSAFGSVALATLACLWLDGFMSVAGLSMVYLVATVGAAWALGRGPAPAVSVACVSALNFFFVPPRHSFAVDGAEYWWTLSVLLGVSLALGALVNALRQGRLRAERAAQRSAQLHALGEALVACSGHEAMARCTAQWLQQTMALPCSIALRAPVAGAPLAHWSAPPGHGGFHAASVQWALDHGRPLGRGCDDWPELPLWCAPFSARDPAGAVQLNLEGTAAPTADAQRHWLALVRQVGLCIERERAAVAARTAQDSASAEAAGRCLGQRAGRPAALPAHLHGPPARQAGRHASRAALPADRAGGGLPPR